MNIPYYVTADFTFPNGKMADFIIYKAVNDGNFVCYTRTNDLLTLITDLLTSPSGTEKLDFLKLEHNYWCHSVCPDNLLPLVITMEYYKHSYALVVDNLAYRVMQRDAE